MGLLLGGTAVFGGLVLAFGGPLAGAALFAAIIVGLVVLRDIEIRLLGRDFGRLSAAICHLALSTLA